MPALPPITTTVCPSSSGSRRGGEAAVVVLIGRRQLVHVAPGVLGGLLRRLAALARDDVGGVPPRPVVLRGGRFVLAVVLLGLSQKLGERRDVSC